MRVKEVSYLLSNNYMARPAFKGAVTKVAQVAKKINIGSMPKGDIGQISVKNARGENVLLTVEKYVSTIGDNYETYFLKNNKDQVVGSMDITINEANEMLNGKDYVCVNSLLNYAIPRNDIYSKKDEEYKQIGTRLLQIAQKRSEEAGCRGKLKTISMNNETKEFYKKTGFTEDMTGKYGNLGANEMILSVENNDILKQMYGGLEII